MSNLGKDKYMRDIVMAINERLDTDNCSSITVSPMLPNMILVHEDTIGVVATITVNSVKHVDINILDWYYGAIDMFSILNEAIKDVNSDWFLE